VPEGQQRDFGIASGLTEAPLGYSPLRVCWRCPPLPPVFPAARDGPSEAQRKIFNANVNFGAELADIFGDQTSGDPVGSNVSPAEPVRSRRFCEDDHCRDAVVT
jgi:hypothetical protein